MNRIRVYHAGARNFVDVAAQHSGNWGPWYHVSHYEIHGPRTKALARYTLRFVYRHAIYHHMHLGDVRELGLPTLAELRAALQEPQLPRLELVDVHQAPEVVQCQVN